MTRDEKVAGLRALADWLDAHPDAPLPYAGREIAYYVQADDDTAGVETVRQIAQPLGMSVTVGDDEAYCSVHFGGGVSWVARYLYRNRVREHDALMSYRGAVEVAS